ncbi:MAG: type II toxin-antitoxin system ParD family antitoxin [Beijerinckiaceae bacterium]|nr:type II toxin-antitoxin system ParD family antitoxin [Beijerinckiaceae bacterium]
MKHEDEMVVTLPDDLARMVRAEVSKGEFPSDSAVVQQALRERYIAQQQAELDRALDVGLADLKAGRRIPMEEAFRNVRAALFKT